MKKELRILVILITVLLVGTVGYYFMPKKFGKNVNPSEVDHINVFDGNTGTGFTITDSEKFRLETLEKHTHKPSGYIFVFRHAFLWGEGMVY